MAKSFRAVLSPLLIVNYMCGLKIFEFPTGYLRPWFSLLYNLLLNSSYCFFLINNVVPYVPTQCKEYLMCVWLQIFTAFFTILVGIYYDKKFRNCLKKLAIVDDTLEKLGTITKYQRLHTRIMWIISGWITISLLMNYGDSIWWQHLYDDIKVIYIPFILNYCAHINIIDDLMFGSILRYIELKFDQMNEHLRKLINNNCTDKIYEIKQARNNPILQSHQPPFSNIISSERIIWIVIHLHLELCKICREINSIFGIQITLKMACTFGFIAQLLHEFFDYIFIKNHSRNVRGIYIIFDISWIIIYIFKVLLINCMCEKVSAKANDTKDLVNKVSYSTCNVEIRENIMQFFLQITQAPLKFYGLGLFQFGFKFLHRYSESILTLLIILIQANKNTYLLLRYFD